MWIIDRFEGGFAVIECDDVTFEIPVNALPAGVREGDVISVEIDDSKTCERKKNIDSLMNKLFGENR